MTYTAFYIPAESVAENIISNQDNTQNIENKLTAALKDLSPQIDIKKVSQNLSIQGSTEFIQKYACGALTLLVQGLPITNQTMLDSLFNGYAPALNITAAQTGYNSLIEMKNAAANGNINVSNFIQGLSNGLSTVEESFRNFNYKKYGEEILIELTTYISENYYVKEQDKHSENNQNQAVVSTDIKEPTCYISGKISNNTQSWSSEEAVEKIKSVMQARKRIVLRHGSKIYENALIKKFKYIKKSDDIITVDIEVRLYDEETSAADKRTVNKNLKKDKQINNYTSPINYAGIYA